MTHTYKPQGSVADLTREELRASERFQLDIVECQLTILEELIRKRSSKAYRVLDIAREVLWELYIQTLPTCKDDISRLYPTRARTIYDLWIYSGGVPSRESLMDTIIDWCHDIRKESEEA